MHKIGKKLDRSLLHFWIIIALDRFWEKARFAGFGRILCRSFRIIIQYGKRNWWENYGKLIPKNRVLWCSMALECFRSIWGPRSIWSCCRVYLGSTQLWSLAGLEKPGDFNRGHELSSGCELAVKMVDKVETPCLVTGAWGRWCSLG